MKLLASDFDGTLIFTRTDGNGVREQYIGDEDIAAIKEFQAAGNLFGVCTGRDKRAIDSPTAGRISYDFYLLSNGAVVLTGDGTELERHFIPKDLAVEIYEAFGAELEIMYVQNGISRLINARNGAFRSFPALTHPRELPGNEVQMFAFHYPDEDSASEARIHIVERFGSQIEVFQNVNSLDFAPYGCSKGNALKRVAVHFGIPKSDISAIGDSWNDLPMFSSAGSSFTFFRSPEGVREKADTLVSSVAECIGILLG